MTSLLFIFIVALVLILLVYWVLSTLQPNNKPEPRKFNFESASELAVNDLNEFYLAENTIKMQISADGNGMVYWQLTRAKWDEINAEHGIKPDVRHLVLRITEAGERVHYSDMKVRTIAGQYRFRLQPKSAYYVTLGIKYRKIFIPILTSNSVMMYG